MLRCPYLPHTSRSPEDIVPSKHGPISCLHLAFETESPNARPPLRACELLKGWQEAQ